ncbi:E3 ubiquitin-protein ligase MIB2-like protein [Aphelenchoides avenae]|nr:E3 ubiquitin-protein ligase MIB2-like protein [Aphelenchus avenae]
METDEVRIAADESIAPLSEAECRRALLIAARVIDYAKKLSKIVTSEGTAWLSQYKVRNEQVIKWDETATELAREAERQIKKMAARERSCSKRLNTLVSASQTVARGKPPAQVAVLAESVAAVEQLFQAEREKVKQLEGRLVEVEKQLGASRGSLLASNVEIENLRKQLSVATQNGRTHATRADELEEKLRCSICMDRLKNVAFACGHACCDECASEWKQCPNKCEGPKSRKPVKHMFPLYL